MKRLKMLFVFYFILLSIIDVKVASVIVTNIDDVKSVFVVEDSRMSVDDSGIKLIKKHEGLALVSYTCPANVWTIGYGHTKGVKEGQVITESQAESLLRDDLREYEDFINDLNIELTQNEFNAMVSFCMNVGGGNFLKSSVYRELKGKKRKDVVCQSLRRWNKIKGGRVLRGLTERREDEAEMFKQS